MAFQKFIQAQNQLQSALSRLIAVSENYPQLKSDALFRDLQSQLEGTENRIAVARNRYIKTVQEFNTTVRQFPTNLTAMIFKMNVKPNFTVADEGDDQRAAQGRFRQARGARCSGACARCDCAAGIGHGACTARTRTRSARRSAASAEVLIRHRSEASAARWRGRALPTHCVASP